MKKKKQTTALKAVALLLISTLAACQQEEPGTALDKTPLTMGSINISTEGATTRTTAEDFFKDRDKLYIDIDGILQPFQTQWNGTAFGPIDPAIYLEDVWNPANGQTQTLTAEFGSDDIHYYQTTEEDLHLADYLRGDLTVDPATHTLTCATMTHQHTLFIISIAKGEGWATDEAFRAHFATGTYYIHTTNGLRVLPYDVIAMNKAILFIAILPPDLIPSSTGDDIFTLTVPGTNGHTRTLRLAEPIAPTAGQSIIITATYHNKGTFTGITATLEEWKDITHSGELPALTEAELARRAEAERFLAWATGTGAGSWEEEDFTLQCDINLQGVDFEPIGSVSVGPFNKTFDGRGHTISGLVINKPADNAIGLFGFINTISTIRNLTVVGNVTGQNAVGGITGLNDGTITGCTFRGTVTASGDDVGGIAAFNNGLIAGCRVTHSTLTSSSRTGGIAGYNNTNASGIIACLADDVTLETTFAGQVHLGGIAGYNMAPLTACVSASITLTAPNVTDPTDIYAGDIAGYNDNTTPTACIPLGDGGATLTDAQILEMNTAIGNLCDFHWQANPASPVGAYPTPN